MRSSEAFGFEAQVGPAAEPAERLLRAALRSGTRVRGLTHATYRYPARFSPMFVRACLDAYSEPGDYVLDPFLGGGTTAVEALAAGRRVGGFDVNELSLILSRAKTTPLYARDRVELREWLDRAFVPHDEIADDHRLVNAPPDLVRAFRPAVSATHDLSPRRRDAARAALLHAGQWALDGREVPASADTIPDAVSRSLEALFSGLDELIEGAREMGVLPSALGDRKVLRHQAAAEAASARALNRMHRRFRLVVTSPPYPGVHVLYHRWQVRGRSETALPYWLADANDGAGAMHYTMGGRSQIGVERYFASMLETWRALRRLLAPKATVVQLIAFAEPLTQLPRYLEAMDQAGYRYENDVSSAGWRDVPNRKWYYRTRPDRGGSQEVLLVHTAP